MATYLWRSSTTAGNWTNGANWLNSTTGNTGTVPGSGDDVIIDATSGPTSAWIVNYNVTSGQTIKSINFTGFKGQFLQSSAYSLTVSGDFILSSEMTYTNPGRVFLFGVGSGLTWKNAWVSGTSYVVNDAVEYNGVAYYCKLATSSTTNPAALPLNWGLVSTSNILPNTLKTFGKAFGENLAFGSQTVICYYKAVDQTVVTGNTYIRRGNVEFAGGSSIPDGPISIANYATYTPSLKTFQIFVGEFAVTKKLTAISIELTGQTQLNVPTLSLTNVWEPGSYGDRTYLTLNVSKLFVTGSYSIANYQKTINPGNNDFGDYYILTTGTSVCGIRIDTVGTPTFKNIYFGAGTTAVPANYMTLRACRIKGDLDFTYSVGNINFVTLNTSNLNPALWVPSTVPFTDIIQVEGSLIIPSDQLCIVRQGPNISFVTPSSTTSNINLNGKSYNGDISIDGAATDSYVVLRNNLTITSKVSGAAQYSTLKVNSGNLFTKYGSQNYNISCQIFEIAGGNFDTYPGNNTITVSGLPTSNYISNTGSSSILIYASVIAPTIKGKILTFNGPVTCSGTIEVASGSVMTFNNTLGGSAAITQSAGTLAINKNSTISSYTRTGTTSCSLIFGSNETTTLTLNITGSGTCWDVGNPAPSFASSSIVNTLKYTILKLTNTSASSATFAGGSQSYGTVWWNRIGTSADNIVTGNNIYNVFKDGQDSAGNGNGIVAHKIIFTSGSTHNFDSFQVNSAPGTTISLDGTTTAVYNFNKTSPTGSAAVECYNLNVSHCKANFPGEFANPPYYTWWAYSSKDSNVATLSTGWNFVNKKYWIGKVDNNWNNSQNWSTKSTDTPSNCERCNAGVPTAIDNVIFSNNSNVNCKIDADSSCKSLTFRGDNGVSDYGGTLSGTSALSIVGGMTLSPTMIYSYTGTITFTDTTTDTTTGGSYNISSNGIEIKSNLVFTSVYDNTAWTFLDYLKLYTPSASIIGTLTLNRGNIKFSRPADNADPLTNVKYYASIGRFISNGTSVRSIALVGDNANPAGSIEITGCNTVVGSTTTYCWDANVTTNFTNKILNIYVTSKFDGTRQINGNDNTGAINNLYFYAPSTPSATRFADYIGTVNGTKVDNVYLVGNFNSSGINFASTTLAFTINTGTNTTINKLDFDNSTLIWAQTLGSATNPLIIGNSLKLSPNLIYNSPPDITFTNTTSGFIDANGSGTTYPGDITINASSSAIVIYIPSANTSLSNLTLNTGTVSLINSTTNVPTTLIFKTFSINSGGSLYAPVGSTLQTLNTSGNFNISSSVNGGIVVDGLINIFNLIINSTGKLSTAITTVYGETTINGYLKIREIFNCNGKVVVGNLSTSAKVDVNNKFTVGATITLNNGTFNLNYNNPSETYHLRCNRFLNGAPTGTNIKTLYFASGSIIELVNAITYSSDIYGSLNGNWGFYDTTQNIINAEGSTIKITGSASTGAYLAFNGGNNVISDYDSVNGLVKSYYQYAGQIIGTISGTTLTVSQILGDTKILVGSSVLSSIYLTSGTKILSQISGTPGGVGTYSVNINYSTPTTASATSVFHLSTDVNKAPRIKYGNVVFESTAKRTEYVYGANVFQNFTDNYQSQGAHTLYFESLKTNVFLASNGGSGFSVNGFLSGTTVNKTLINTITTGISVSTNYHYLYLDASQNVLCSYLDIRHSAASSSNLNSTWTARASNDGDTTLPIVNPTIGWKFENKRYWVGRGTLNTVNNTKSWNDVQNWAEVSGGEGGFSIPINVTTVIFDNSPYQDATGKNVYIPNNALCLNFDCKTFDGTFLMDGYNTSTEKSLTINGNLDAGPSLITFPHGASTPGLQDPTYIRINSSGVNNIIKTYGNNLNCNFQFSGTGSFTNFLGDNLTTAGYIKINSGIFNTSLNGGITSYNITCARFLSYGPAAVTLYMNNSTFTLTGNDTYTYPPTASGSVKGVWSTQGNGTGTNVNVNAGTSNIIFNNTTANTDVSFISGGNNKIYYNVEFDRGSSVGCNNYIKQESSVGGYSNVFNIITDKGLASHSLRFPPGALSVTVNKIVADDTTSLNRLTIDSTTSTGIVTLYGTDLTLINYVTVNRINAEPCKFISTVGYIQGPNTTGWNDTTNCATNVKPSLALIGVGQ